MRFLDLFCGAGGLSLGFLEAGWQCVGALDYSSDAIATYRLNFPKHWTIQCDISSFSASDAGLRRKIDWVIGGPPCQGFSTVGKRLSSDPRNLLISEFVRIVREVSPLGFLLENVLGLRDMNFVRSTARSFEEIGYHVDCFVLRSADFGIPQFRQRLFFVGNRRNRGFLPPASTVAGPDLITVDDAIGDLPRLKAGDHITSYDRPPMTPYQRKMRGLSRYLQGHEASSHPPRLLKAISFIPDGGDRTFIPRRYQPTSGFHNSYSRLCSTAPAVAVTQNMGKPSGTRCIHPTQDRGLTAREGARLQGFPDSFHFLGGMTSQRLQVANAVSPILARILARALEDERCWHRCLVDAKMDARSASDWSAAG